ncbi:MAG: hypothetical protein IPM29_00040 [Planctomycetes bacterium]|nr:hypothetical protein [Planctomycetota bacterium]
MKPLVRPGAGPLLAALLSAVAASAQATGETHWPDVTAFAATLAEHDLAGPYDELRGVLARAGELFHAQCVSSATESLLREPLAAPARALAWTDAALAAARSGPPDLFALLQQAAALRDLPELPAELGAARRAHLAPATASLGARLDVAEGLCRDAAVELDAAFAALSPAEREQLAAELPALLQRFVADVYVLSVERFGRAFTERIAKVDQAALLRAAAQVAPLLEPDFWLPLAGAAAPDVAVERPAGVDGELLARRDTPLGPILVGGPGPNRYALDALLIVDVGGDDAYGAGPARATLAHPIGLVVDLGGDDTWSAPAPGSSDPCGGQGGAVCGIAAVLDVAGDDRYAAARVAQGAGLCGVGLLLDLAGDDHYDGDALVQGAGLFGVGVLLDAGAGADVHSAGMLAQGFGGALGYGLLCDLDGADRRTATGRYPSSYGTDGQFQGLSQGAGVGLRGLGGASPQVAGGFGILLDGGGDDVDRVGEFGHGIGYFLGTGIARDVGGDDRVEAARYGIASAAHQAVGLVLDDAGDDRYEDPFTASLGGTWDCSVAILVDAAGDDRYHGAGITLGAATITSFAALVDGGGRDVYATEDQPATAFGAGGHPADVRNRVRSVSLFADLGGGADRYPPSGLVPAPADGLRAVRRARHRFEDREAESGVGLFVDR